MKILIFKDLKPKKGIPHSYTQLWRQWTQDPPKFPPPFKMGHINCWTEEQIDEHIAKQIAERDAKQGEAA